jgi:surface antigen
MIGVAILDILCGSSIGQSLDQGDRVCTGDALQHAPDGQTVRLQNPDSGHSYNVAPIKTWQNADGRYCREYSATADIG